MQKQVALVTGASSGHGRVVAERLSQRGFRVFGTSRNDIDAIEPQGSFEWITLDVHSEEAVTACIQKILSRTGRMDVLVNNAGSAAAGPLEEVPIETAKELFETNFFGVVRMVQAVLPTMRKQGTGRIINMGSLAGATCSPGMGMYAASKFALSGYTETLRAEVRAFGIHVSLVMPCMIRGWSISKAFQPRENLSAYDAFRNAVLPRIEAAAQDGIEMEAVVKCVVRLAQTGSPRFRHMVGGNARLTLAMKALLPERVFEKVIHRFFRIPD